MTVARCQRVNGPIMVVGSSRARSDNLSQTRSTRLWLGYSKLTSTELLVSRPPRTKILVDLNHNRHHDSGCIRQGSRGCGPETITPCLVLVWELDASGENVGHISATHNLGKWIIRTFRRQTFIDCRLYLKDWLFYRWFNLKKLEGTFTES
jgi:hypothetical protein